MSADYFPAPPRKNVNFYRRHMTPLTDVVFLLVVFFMMSTEYGKTSAVPILAKKADSVSESAPTGGKDPAYDAYVMNNAPITAVLLGKKMVNINGMIVPLEQSAYTLKTFLAHRKFIGDVRILCRPEARIQELADMISVAKAAGAEKLNIGYVKP
ncbi:MAG: biopolymer transporter ExbD [Rickettsiales bacterium]